MPSETLKLRRKDLLSNLEEIAIAAALGKGSFRMGDVRKVWKIGEQLLRLRKEENSAE